MAVPEVFIWGSSSPGGPGAEPRYSVWSAARNTLEAEAVCEHCLQILTAKRSKFETVGLIDTLILDQSVSRRGLSNILHLFLMTLGRKLCVERSTARHCIHVYHAQRTFTSSHNSQLVSK